MNVHLVLLPVKVQQILLNFVKYVLLVLLVPVMAMLVLQQNAFLDMHHLQMLQQKLSNVKFVRLVTFLPVDKINARK
jgi:predicted CDP-diglyceride synthetase/phosphatidate cytidylyltransferase